MTSAPTEFDITAGTDGEGTLEEGFGKHLNLQCKQCTRAQEAKRQGEEGANRAGKGQWSRTRGKNGGKRQEKGGKSDTRVCWSCGKTGHIANYVQGSWNRSLNAAEGDISEEVHEDGDELHAWCLLEESENEQWQEVTSKKSPARNQN